MKDTAMKVQVIYGILLYFVSFSMAQNITVGNCSITTEFAIQVGGCFLQKFADLIGIIIDLQPLDLPNDYSAHDHEDYSHFNLDSLLLQKTKNVGQPTQTVVLKNLVSRLNAEERQKLSKAAARAQQKHLEETVLKEIIENVDFNVIERSLVQRAGQIIQGLKDRVTSDDSFKLSTQSTIWEIIDGINAVLCLIESPYCDITTCLKTYEEIDFEDNLKWLRCGFKCSDLPEIGQCLHEAFTDCQVNALPGLINLNLEWLADIMLRVFIDYLEMDTCVFEVKTGLFSDDVKEVKISEGVDPMRLRIRSYLPPGVHCMNKFNFMNTPVGALKILTDLLTTGIGKCDVEIQASLSNYLKDLITWGTPFQDAVCPSGGSIPQALIGVDGHFNLTTGSIKLNDTNWNQTFKMYIQSTVENKEAVPKGDKLITSESFTLRMKAGLLFKNTTKFPMTNARENVTKVRTCWTVSDPHINTFDGHFYNNMYEGYFYLYKHNTLPYEVQVVYQRCGKDLNTTCTCAASVRSGNDVFSIDWCRRKGQKDEDRIRRTTLYHLEDALNPGTRIFRLDDGLKYKMLLPHGQMVTISATDGWLNVWIRASAFDKKQRAGLCGYMDGDPENDLTLPNGDIYKGEGSNRTEEPRPFNAAWRVPPKKIILKGASKNDEDGEVSPQCICSHMLLLGVSCECGYNNKLAHVCDHQTTGEITNELYLISKYSITDHPLEEDLDWPDVNVSYKPPKIDWTGKVAACDTWIIEDPVQRECSSSKEWEDVLKAQAFIDVCNQDAKISGEDKHLSLSSRMSARQFCYDYLDFHNNINISVYEDVKAVDCPNDCNPHMSSKNTCKNGLCVCGGNLKGPDCSISVQGKPTMTMPNKTYCDTRYTNCSIATIYGKNFVEGSVSCLINSVKKEANIISSDQIACELGSNEKSFTVGIRVEKYSSDSGNSFKLENFDSLCHVCNSNTGKCTIRKEKVFCYINSHCYSINETSTSDECRVCKPKASQDEFQASKSNHCLAKKQKRLNDENEKKNRIIIACCLSALVVLCTVLVFLISRRNAPDKNQFELVETDTPGPKKISHDEPKFMGIHNLGGPTDDAPDGPAVGKMNETGFINEPERLENHVTSPSGARLNEINARELAEFWYYKQQAEARRRSESVASSVGSRSVGSIGIGGSSMLTPSRVRNDSMASYGMGAAGPVHLGRFARRAYTGTSSSMGAPDEGEPEVAFGIGGGGTAGTGYVSRL